MRVSAGRVIAMVVGVLAILLGLLWIGQGLNLIPGSSMTGNLMWFFIGLVLVIAGALLLAFGVRRRRVRP